MAKFGGHSVNGFEVIKFFCKGVWIGLGKVYMWALLMSLLSRPHVLRRAVLQTKYCTCTLLIVEVSTNILWVIINYLFSYDVTKMCTKELSILLSFCFHGVLEQLKRYVLTKFLFIKVLCFVVEYAWIFLSEQSSYSVLENLLLFRSSLRDEVTLL